MRARVWLMGCASLLSASGGASAQMAANPTAVPDTQPSVPQNTEPSAQGSDRVADIVVTAQRVQQPLQRVPISVQAVTGSDLEARKLNDLAQTQLAIPSLQIEGDSSYSLRGLGSQVQSPTVDATVGVAVDGVSLGVPLYMSGGILDDISQLEVLLGPQGLLFGRNASSGLLNITSNKPVFGQFSGRVYEETDYRDAVPGGKWGEIVKGTVNIPLTQNAALRVNGYFSSQDPVTDFIHTSNARLDRDQRREGGKAKLLWEPTDRLSIYLIGDYEHEGGVGGTQDRTSRAFGTGSITQTFAALDGVTAGPDNLKSGVDGAHFRDVDTGGASATVTYKLSDSWTLSDILAWRAFRLNFNWDTDYTGSDGVNVNQGLNTYHQVSNETRIALTPGGFIDGQAGVYYFGSRLRDHNHIGAGVFGLSPSFNSDTNPLFGNDLNNTVHDRSYAGFGQANIHPTGKLTLSGGIRLTHDNNNIDIRQNVRPYPVPLGLPNVSDQVRVRNTDVSYKVDAQYQITPSVMAYVSYGKGYKGPTFNDSVSFTGEDITVRPETVRDLEAGLKSTLLDRRLRLNFSIFRENYRDLQVQGFDAQASASFATNAARARSQGVEVFAEAKPIHDLTLTAAATALDAKFRSFTNDLCYPGQQNCTAGFTDSSGNRTPTSARFTSTVSATYKHAVFNTVNLVMSGDYYHRSSVNFQSNANPATLLGAINVLGGSVGAEIDNRLDISLFCKNCTNKIYPLYIVNESLDPTLAKANSTVQYFGYNSVRTIGVSAALRF